MRARFKVVGIGARSGVDAEEVVALLREVLLRNVLPREAALSDVLPIEALLEDVSFDGVACLAVPEFRAGEAGILQAAECLGLKIIWVSAAALGARQAECPSYSERALQATGFASVAEGCALAGAGVGSRLIVPKQVGRNVTCAVAVSGGA